MSLSNIEFTLFKESFQNVWIFQLDYVISLILVLLSCLLITRDYQKWKTLAFPLTVGWHVVGINQSLLIYTVLGIMFVIENLSLQLLGNVIKSVSVKVNDIKQYTENSFEKRERIRNEKIKNINEKNMDDYLIKQNTPPIFEIKR